MALVLDGFSARREQLFSYTSRPNCSLHPRGRKLVFWLIALVTLTISSVFAWMGYWLTLPFAGLEIGVLAWAFESLSRRGDDYETLTIDDNEIVVDRLQSEQIEHLQLNRQWATLVKSGNGACGHVRIALRSHGREMELGVFLTDEKRLELANSLQNWISTAH